MFCVTRTATLAFLLVSFSLFSGIANARMASNTLESPNKDFKIVVYIGPINDVGFGVFYKGDLLTRVSGMSFEIADNDQLPATASYTLRHLRDKTDRPVPKPSRFGPNSTGTTEAKAFRDTENNMDYNEMSVVYQKRKEGRGEVSVGGSINPDDYEDVIKIVFRAYNAGIAYRYEIATKEGEPITIKNENVEFVFPDDYSCTVSEKMTARVFVRRTVGIARTTSLSKIAKGHENPLYFEFRKGAWKMEMLLAGTHRHNDFAQLQFQPGRERTGTFDNLYDRHGNVDKTGKLTGIALLLDGDTEIPGTGFPFRTPWRSLLLNSSDGQDMLSSLILPDPPGGREPLFTIPRLPGE